jgi:hypothetical protein
MYILLSGVDHLLYNKSRIVTQISVLRKDVNEADTKAPSRILLRTIHNFKQPFVKDVGGKHFVRRSTPQDQGRRAPMHLGLRGKVRYKLANKPFSKGVSDKVERSEVTMTYLTNFPSRVEETLQYVAQ